MHVPSWKQKVARWLRIPGLQRLMIWGIYLVIPRHQVSVHVVALDEQERVLMLKHVFHPYTPWGLPGGWLGRGEEPEAGALRELREETGLTAVPGPIILLERDTKMSNINIIYLVTVQPGRMCLSHEIMEAKWFPVTGLPSPLTGITRRAIAAAVNLKGKI